MEKIDVQDLKTIPMKDCFQQAKVGKWSNYIPKDFILHMEVHHPGIKNMSFLEKFGLHDYFYQTVDKCYVCSTVYCAFSTSIFSVQTLAIIYEHLSTVHHIPISKFIWLEGMCIGCFKFVDSDDAEHQLVRYANLPREEFYRAVLEADSGEEEEEDDDVDAYNDENVYF